MNNEDFLFVEKYRPKTIADCVLPESTKNTFQEYVNRKEIPNLLLVGSAGVGKCLDPEEEIEIQISEELYKRIKFL